MPVASDILANAKEFTDRYAATVMDPNRLKDPSSPAAGIPSRVYVLKQNSTILGVLTNEQRALDEAHALINASGGEWTEMIPNRYWQQRKGEWHTTVEISAHDVR